jgi:hypothetical protein
VLAGQFIPVGSQHIRFHDDLLSGHGGRHTEEVHHGAKLFFDFGKVETGATRY